MKMKITSANVLIPDELRNDPDSVDLKALSRQAHQKEQDEIAEAELNKKRDELRAQYSYIFDEVDSLPYLNDESGIGGQKDKLDYLFEELVPSQGPADTAAGEIVRAMMRVLYRCYNDGDICFIGYGVETASSAMAFLCSTLDDLGSEMFYDLKNLAENYQGSWNMDEYESQYEHLLVKFANSVADYVVAHPELVAEPNTADCLNWDNTEIVDLEPLEDYDISISDDVMYHLEEGHIGYDDLRYEASNWLNNFDYANVDVDRYSVTFTNCTIEDVEELDHWGERCMEDYGEELNNEFGSQWDNEEEEEEEYEDEEI